MPASRTRYVLDEAIGRPQDWSFSWELKDDVTFGTTCQFCRKNQQRISYEVQRADERRWICQRCAGRYDLGGVLNGVAVDQMTIRATLHDCTERQKLRTCLDVIRRCIDRSDDPAVLEAALHFDRNLQLSPLHAASMFFLLATLPERIDPRIFEIQTRSRAHKQEFGALGLAARALVWPALTPLQQRGLSALGFGPRARASIRSKAAPAADRLAAH
ncbi:hypothetical protein IC608_09395 [Devosia sp. PTR5]|uniref:Uncharacterized protein n=1 Tax=Devosia oryzisoli TaxID=2774138 RepID=A0A927ITD1_9HYPH|nr:hypothetical protein [Devosia oryzisoli]MBD8065688.1 hypothetical protein [Devosia oryzisoli]